jgi:hypothetical protein
LQAISVRLASLGDYFVRNLRGKNELAVSHFGGRKFFNHMEGRNFEQPSQPESVEIKKEDFLIPEGDDYKNPEMLALEPDYLKTPDYGRENLTPHQYRRKISELARRLGLEFREKNPDPARQSRETGVKVFREIVGDILEASEPLIFYEDDVSQPFRAEPTPDFQELDFSTLEENVVEVIERGGKNLQRETERPILENDVLPTDDNSRIREVALKRKNGTEISVVSKRISLTKVRREPFEEFQILQKVQQEGLPGPKPIATIEARGNRYILMEKVEGIPLKKITPETLQKYFGQSEIQGHIDTIKAKVEELKQRYTQSGIIREDWDPKDLIASYNSETQEWVVTPVDFEKTKLKE